MKKDNINNPDKKGTLGQKSGSSVIDKKGAGVDCSPLLQSEEAKAISELSSNDPKDNAPAISELSSNDPKDNTPNTKSQMAKEIADRCKVSIIYENSSGEYFTDKDLALLSENGKREKVHTYDFSSVA